MAEREHACVAQEQVEGAGEERIAEELHQEHRVDPEQRRDQKQRGQTRMHGDRRPHGAHSRPKRPAGRHTSTTAMMTNTTMFDASG